MASGNRRNKDWVLGGRQLVGVFILLVVLFGMVFTLGYLLGRNQYDALRAAASILPGRPDSVIEKPVKRSSPSSPCAVRLVRMTLKSPRRRHRIGIFITPRSQRSRPCLWQSRNP